MLAKLNSLQLTLAILKPDITRVPFNLAAVRQMIIDRNFIVVRSKFVDLQRSDVERFYQEHEGKFFYNRYIRNSTGLHHSYPTHRAQNLHINIFHTLFFSFLQTLIFERLTSSSTYIVRN